MAYPDLPRSRAFLQSSAFAAIVPKKVPGKPINKNHHRTSHKKCVKDKPCDRRQPAQPKQSAIACTMVPGAARRLVFSLFYPVYAVKTPYCTSVGLRLLKPIMYDCSASISAESTTLSALISQRSAYGTFTISRMCISSMSKSTLSTV